MNRVIKLPRVLFTISLISTPTKGALANPCNPAKQTITKETEANKKVLTSFSATKKPTINPSMKSMLNTIASIPACTKIPTMTDIIIPKVNAQALIRFSLALIAILFKFDTTLFYLNSLFLKNVDKNVEIEKFK